MGYGGQGQYGNTGTRQYMPAQTFESSYYPGVTPHQQYWGQNPGRLGSMGLGRLGDMIYCGRTERKGWCYIGWRLLYNSVFFFSCKIERTLRFANDDSSEESGGKKVRLSNDNKNIQVHI